MVGLNSGVITGAALPEVGGFAYLQYLTPGGFASQPRFLAANSCDIAEGNLRRVGAALQSTALPWFARNDDLRSLADLLGPELDGLKGKLLLAHGNGPEAKPWFERYLERLEKLPKDDDIEIAITETKHLLTAC
jgi:hypothetical protein